MLLVKTELVKPRFINVCANVATLEPKITFTENLRLVFSVDFPGQVRVQEEQLRLLPGRLNMSNMRCVTRKPPPMLTLEMKAAIAARDSIVLVG